MWIKGKRRGGAKDLSTHLLRTDENESVAVREIEGFTFDKPTKTNFDKALRQMEAIGYGKGAKRNLYHVILAPAYGETLSAEQRKYMVDDYVKQMGFQDHQRVVMEHWKKGKQHFHIVFNIIHPATGRIHELKFTKCKEWDISRGLEAALGLSTPVIKGKSAKTSHMQRGKRTGIDPRKMRKEITAIYHASKTTKDFIEALDKAGYALTRGRRDQLVLVDKVGDTHGLMRMIEGKKLSDLRKKFEGIEKVDLPLHADLVKARKPITKAKSGKAGFRYHKTIYPSRVRSDVRKAFRTSKSGAAFYHTLNRHGYALGRGKRGYAVIDANGYRYDLAYLLGKDTARGMHKTFPDLAQLPAHHASAIVRRLKAEHSSIVSAATKPAAVTHSPSPSTAKSSIRKTRFKKGSRGSGGKDSVIGIGGSTTTPLLHDGGASTSPSTQPSPSGKAIKAPFGKAEQTAKHQQEQEHKPEPFRPPKKSKGWPPAAILDWELWGRLNPAKFFALWPELDSGGSTPNGGPS